MNRKTRKRPRRRQEARTPAQPTRQHEGSPSPREARAALINFHFRDDFLEAQEGRLLGMFPDKTFTPDHRTGVWLILRHVYPACRMAQVTHGILGARAERDTKRYIRGLKPPSFSAFSAVTTRAVRIRPGQLMLYRQFYKSVLPVVQEMLRRVREYGLDQVDTPDDLSVSLSKKLRGLLEERFPELRGHAGTFVRRDIFLRRGRLRPPHEVARAVAARVAGIGDKSQVQLERYLNPPALAPWRVPEWETEAAAALAQALPREPQPGVIVPPPVLPRRSL